MIKKIFIFLCAFIFVSSVLLYGEVSNAKYKKNLQIGVDENGQTVKESVTIFDEPQKTEPAPSEQFNNDYIYVNPYYNGNYPNYYIPTYYPNYYNGYGGHSEFIIRTETIILRLDRQDQSRRDLLITNSHKAEQVIITADFIQTGIKKRELAFSFFLLILRN